MVMGVDDIGAAFASNLLLSTAQGEATSLLNPLKRGATYAANREWPTVIPPVSMLASAWYQRKINDEAFKYLMSGHGIWLDGNNIGSAWRAVIAATKPPVPALVIARMFAGNRIDESALDELMRRLGIIDTAAIDALKESFGAPPWNWVLEQRRLGQLSDNMWNMLSRSHAIGEKTYRELWETSTSPLSQQIALDLWLRGMIDSTRAAQHVAASGVISNPDHKALFDRASVSGIPDMHVLLQMRRLDIITQDKLQEWSDKAGYTRNMAQDIATNQSTVFTVAQVFDLLNRGHINADRAKSHLWAGGFNNHDDREAISKLRYHNPGVVEVARYQRAFDANALAVQKLKLHTEYPESVAQAATRTGWDQETITVGTTDGQPANVSAAKAEWVSHWAMPNPNEAVRMKLFLTEHRVNQLRDIGLPVERISDEELDGLLQGAAVPPGWRPYLKASQYKQIPLREIIRTARFGKFTHAEIVDRYTQLGYIPEDAERMANSLEAYIKSLEDHATNAEMGKVFNERIRTVKEGYSLGYIDNATASKTLASMGFSPDQIFAILQLVVYERNHKLAVAGVSAIEHAFSRGELNAAGTIAALTKIGIVNSVAQIYLKQWQITHTVHMKHASTQEILRWLEEGIITVANAETRLHNLGWTNPDVVALIAEARREQAKLAGQAAAAQSRDRKQRSAALASVAKQAASTQKAAIVALRRAAGIKTLVKWWLDDILTEAQVEERGQLIGYSIADIHNYMNDALVNQSKRAQRKANAASKKPTTNGSSVAP